MSPRAEDRSHIYIYIIYHIIKGCKKHPVTPSQHAPLSPALRLALVAGAFALLTLDSKTAVASSAVVCAGQQTIVQPLGLQQARDK